jgi:hypothetical protein
VNYTVEADPFSVVVGDFNGDGKLDLAVGNHGGGVSVLMGNGDGTFQPQVAYSTPGLLNNLAAADFTGDGKLDLVTANPLVPGLSASQGGGNVSVLLNRGYGTFQSAENIAIPDNPEYVAVGDFNKDGRLDLITANGDNTVSVLLGNGDGTFRAAIASSAGGPAFAVAVADFNGDGELDTVIANGSNNTVSVLLGNGDGTFQAPQTLATGGHLPISVAVGDLTGDGRPDVVVANFFSNNVGVLLNEGVHFSNTSYVTQLYADLLNRQPDTGGLAFFTGLLNQNLASRAQVVLDVEQSVEYRIDQVESLYAKVLNRQADPAGLQYFVASMETGSSFEDVETSMLGSTEFYARAGGNTDGFLNLLYQTVLGRSPDSAGQADFSALLDRGFSRFVVSFFVVHSIEARQYLVNGFYRAFLDRAADPAGLAAFTAPRPGGYSDDLILAAILGSNEYFADVQRKA